MEVRCKKVLAREREGKRDRTEAHRREERRERGTMDAANEAEGEKKKTREGPTQKITRQKHIQKQTNTHTHEAVTNTSNSKNNMEKRNEP